MKNGHASTEAIMKPESDGSEPLRPSPAVLPCEPYSHR